MTPTRVLLVRHGSTEHTEQRRVSGSGADPGLSAAGRAQVERLRTLLVPQPLRSREGPPGDSPVLVVSSPARRARESADLLGGPRDVVEGWREVGFGEWEGLTYAEIAARDPDRFAAWQASSEVAPPGGESLVEVGFRVREAWDALVAGHPASTVVVVTHVAPIRTVLRGALAAGPQAMWRLRIDPASVSTVSVWPDGGVEVGSVNVGGS